MKNNLISTFFKWGMIITLVLLVLSSNFVDSNALNTQVCYFRKIAVQEPYGFRKMFYAYDIITYCVDSKGKLFDIEVRNSHTPIAYSAEVDFISTDGSGQAATINTSWYVTGFFKLVKLDNISVKATTRKYRIYNTGKVERFKK